MFEVFDDRPHEQDGAPELLAAGYNAALDQRTEEPDLTIARGVHGQPDAQPVSDAFAILPSEDRGPRYAGRIGTGAYVAKNLPTPAADAQQGRLPGSSLGIADSIENDMLKLRPGTSAGLEEAYRLLRAQVYPDEA